MTKPTPPPLSQADFAKGWRLLVLQPWGWRYNRIDEATGRPTHEAAAQMEFYYGKLNWAQPAAWWAVADLFAQGSAWPSVTELKQALQVENPRHVVAVTDQRRAQGEPMPPEVRELIEKLNTKGALGEGGE
jgi:hypothetical protein